MKQIELTQGKVALVDDADYEELSKHNWFAHKSRNTFYAERKVSKNTHIKMHRQLLGLESGDGKKTDHQNHNGLDNRHCNIRICTQQQNHRNLLPLKRKSSKYKGVSWFKLRKKWRVRITVNKKVKHLGYFNHEQLAALVYNLAAKKYFGNFAFLNKIS